MSPKDVVFKVFFRKNDGTLEGDLEIYRDGTWKALQTPTDSKSLAWFNLIESVRKLCLEDMKKGGYGWGEPAQFVPAENEDSEAFTSLCAAYSHPKSLDLNNCLDGYVVQYFGDGEPWRESDEWKEFNPEETTY